MKEVINSKVSTRALNRGEQKVAIWRQKQKKLEEDNKKRRSARKNLIF